MHRPTDDSVRLLPLGGLGEIGMNCLAIEQADGILVVDCGIGFPHDDLGVDVIHPDFSWLRHNRENISGVFITHGHEDHIGALPYLLDEIDVPVWGPRYALGLVERRLVEHGFELDEVQLNVAQPGHSYQVGPFEVEPVRVTHSIVEASALVIKTRAGRIFHTGDFNFDADPPDGEPADEARLRFLGEEGVRLMLSDSTNVDVPERGGSEKRVGTALERLIGGSEGRVVVAMFASNVARLMLLGEIAQRVGRKIVLLGRSLRNHYEVATATGKLGWPSNLLLHPEQAATRPRNEVLVLAGGSQGERQSAMYRLAAGTHQWLSLDADDSVVFSSRIIPGNERAVFDMMSGLLRRGVKVHTRVSDPDVHTSGHAGRTEQRHMLELIRPQSFVPVHGTLHHMMRHAELARSAGVSDILVVENGTALRLSEQGLAEDEPFAHGKISIARGGEPLDEDTLVRRAELGRRGLAVVSVALEDGRAVGHPEVSTHGVPGVDEDEASLRLVAEDVLKSLDRVRGWKGVDLVQEVRRAARRRIIDISGCRPVVEVHLLPV